MAGDVRHAHDKPVVIPEWAVTIRSDGHGLGDDPLYVAKMAQWIATHDVAFTSYFDVDAPDGQHDILDGAFSQSLAVFRRSFAAVQARRPRPRRLVAPRPGRPGASLGPLGLASSGTGNPLPSCGHHSLRGEVGGVVPVRCWVDVDTSLAASMRLRHHHACN